MKTAIVRSILSCLFMVFCSILQAQDDALPLAFKESTIGQLSVCINDYYIEPDLALKVSEHLKKRLGEGHFDDVSDTARFAESLTKEVQSISKDKHMLIRPVTQSQGPRSGSTKDFLARHRVQVARDPKSGDEDVYETLKKCEQAGLLGREMINGIGYEYLVNFKNSKVAERIFRANTLLFPKVANGFDSYAEALVMNGKMDEAALNYQKAVDIAKSTNDPELKLFEDNLEKAIGRIEKK